MLEVGRVVRPHGLRGQVVVAMTTNRVERTAIGAVLFAGARRLTVDRASRLSERDRWLVAFSDVGDREAAEALRGAVLCAEPLVDEEALWVHELIGAEVVGTDGTPLGRVREVEANPASDLLVLESGGLVPLTFVSRGDGGKLVVDAPPGLL